MSENSVSENISLWKKRSEIDYFPLFMSLWLALNTWMRDHCDGNKDRERVESLKDDGLNVARRFVHLLNGKDSDGVRFKGNLGELHRALANARILYDNDRWPNQTISFANCTIDWNNGNPAFESVIKQKRQHNKIKLDDELWVDGDTDRLFAAYIEIVYQIRCALFHGNLTPIPENERVIRQLYLTLSMIAESI